MPAGITSTWTITKETAAEQRGDAQALNPYDTEASFQALSGVRLVGTRHYQVSGTLA